jgi:hypothetical protein
LKRKKFLNKKLNNMLMKERSMKNLKKKIREKQFMKKVQAMIKKELESLEKVNNKRDPRETTTED